MKNHAKDLIHWFEGVLKRQSYIQQISREKISGVSLVDVENNKGVKIDD